MLLAEQLVLHVEVPLEVIRRTSMTPPIKERAFFSCIASFALAAATTSDFPSGRAGRDPCRHPWALRWQARRSNLTGARTRCSTCEHESLPSTRGARSGSHTAAPPQCPAHAPTLFVVLAVLQSRSRLRAGQAHSLPPPRRLKNAAIEAPVRRTSVRPVGGAGRGNSRTATAHEGHACAQSPSPALPLPRCRRSGRSAKRASSASLARRAQPRLRASTSTLTSSSPMMSTGRIRRAAAIAVAITATIAVAVTAAIAVATAAALYFP